MSCENCKHLDLGINDIPCLVCPNNPRADGTRRGPRVADLSREPCPMTGRSCRTCVHSMVPQTAGDRVLCMLCGIHFANYEPVQGVI